MAQIPHLYTEPMTTTGYLILFIYLAVLIAIGVWCSRRQSSIQDFFVAGRSMPTWAALAAIVATETSAVTFIGAPAQAFVEGGDFWFLQVVMGYILSRFVLSYFFLPKFFEHEIVTIYQFLGRRFGKEVQKTSGVFFFITRAMAAGVRHFAAAVVIQAMTGWDVTTAIIITGIIAVLYSVMGGLAAVIWTEVIQFAVMMLGGLFVCFYILNTIPGGLPTIIEYGSSAGKFTVFHWDWSGKGFLLGLIGGFCLNLASHGADQDLVQRLLSCRNLRSAQWAMVLSGGVVFVLFSFLLFVGVMLNRFYDGALPEGVTKANEILPFFAVDVMPPAAGAFVLAAILSAAMSSTASALNSLSSTTITDFVIPSLKEELCDSKLVLLSRAFTVLWMIVLIGIALISSTLQENILDLALSIPSYTFGSLLAAFVLGIFTPMRSQRAVTIGMIVGVVAVVSVSFAGFHWTVWVPAGALTSTISALLLDRILADDHSQTA
ncbi:MAG: sodium/solute symporter [Candidatus Hinthialibacter antarcticus]|nr:sodium/solute symporter [Candidatus Hinthialibacter antarcticus]